MTPEEYKSREKARKKAAASIRNSPLLASIYDSIHPHERELLEKAFLALQNLLPYGSQCVEAIVIGVLLTRYEHGVPKFEGIFPEDVWG